MRVEDAWNWPYAIMLSEASRACVDSGATLDSSGQMLALGMTEQGQSNLQ